MNNKLKDLLEENFSVSERLCTCQGMHYKNIEFDVLTRFILKPSVVSVRNSFIKTDEISFVYSFNSREVCFETETFVSGTEDVLDVYIVAEDKRYVFMLLSNEKIVLAEYGNLENKINFCKDVKQMFKIQDRLYFLVEKESSCYVNEVIFNNGRFTHKIASEKINLKNAKVMKTNDSFYFWSKNKFYNKNGRINVDFEGDFIYEYCGNTIVGKKKENDYLFIIYEDCFMLSSTNVLLKEKNYEIKAFDCFIAMRNGNAFVIFRIADGLIKVYHEQVVEVNVLSFDFYVFENNLLLTILTDEKNVIKIDEFINLTSRSSEETWNHIKKTSNLVFYHDVLKLRKKIPKEEKNKIDRESFVETNQSDTSNKEGSSSELPEINQKTNMDEKNNYTREEKNKENTTEGLSTVKKESFSKTILNKIFKSIKEKESAKDFMVSKMETEKESENKDIRKEESEINNDDVKISGYHSNLNKKEDENKNNSLSSNNITKKVNNLSTASKLMNSSDSSEKKENKVVVEKKNIPSKEDRFQKYLTVRNQKEDKNHSNTTNTVQKDKEVIVASKCNEMISKPSKSLAVLEENFENILEAKIERVVKKVFGKTDIVNQFLEERILPKFEGFLNEIRMQMVSEIKQLRQTFFTGDTMILNKFVKLVKVNKNKAVEMFCGLGHSEMAGIIRGFDENCICLDDFSQDELIVMLKAVLDNYTSMDYNLTICFVEKILERINTESLDKRSLTILVLSMRLLENDGKNILNKNPSVFYLIRYFNKKVIKLLKKEENQKQI